MPPRGQQGETTMDDQTTAKVRQLDDAIARYIRPDTFPLAIRMIVPGEALPEGVRVPSEAFGESWIVEKKFLDSRNESPNCISAN